MLNSRFAIEVHIVSLLVMNQEAITSDFIAGSVNCNPVLVRKELSALKKAGIVETQEGKNGGVVLVKNPKSIFLDELYRIAYEDAALFTQNKNTPNPLCTVGRNINAVMQTINSKVETNLLKELHKTSIHDLIKHIDSL